MNIYTKTGDSGQTSLANGDRVSKSHPRVEAYGTIDELSAHIGLLIAHIERQRYRGTEIQRASVSDAIISECLRIQDTLVSLGTVLANGKGDPSFIPATHSLEMSIDSMYTPWQGFVLPGGTLSAATAQVCRTIARRAERQVCQIAESTDIDPEIQRYLNRLSDYFFVLALRINSLSSVEEHYASKSEK